MRHVLALLATMLAAPLAAQDGSAPAALPQVLIETSAGDMTVEVDTAAAPITARNFLRYVEEKKLDGVPFYRVVKVQPEFGFVQFGALGDPSKTLPPIKHEPTSQTGLSHTDGVVSVARLEAGSARGEFTIMVGDNSYGMDAGKYPDDKLGYAAFARVIQGRDVLVKILDTPVDPAKATQGAFKGEMPGDPVSIKRARRVGAGPIL